MTIVFKSGKTLKVDSSIVEQIRDRMPQTGAEYFFWINDTKGKPAMLINVFDISHIKP